MTLQSWAPRAHIFGLLHTHKPFNLEQPIPYTKHWGGEMKTVREAAEWGP